jgi:hypothetical protein
MGLFGHFLFDTMATIRASPDGLMTNETALSIRTERWKGRGNLIDEFFDHQTAAVSSLALKFEADQIG